MPTSLSPAAHVVLLFEVALILGGLVLLWRHVASPSARTIPSRLPLWEISAFGFFLFVWCVLSGGFVAQLLAVGILSRLPDLDSDSRLIIAGGAFQFGMLAGCLLFRGFHDGWNPSPSVTASPPPPPPPQNAAVAGVITFVVAIPLLALTAMGWHAVLTLFDVPIQKQDLVNLFAKAESPLLLTTMIFLGIVVAPVTEELVFRAGLFRFARGRLPRSAAYALPALIFAAVHGNVASFAPLFMLGLVFSFAYARTGSIAVPMVAHGLFNLNTVMMILVGVSP